MTDVMTPEQRSRCMAAIKGKDTKQNQRIQPFHILIINQNKLLAQQITHPPCVELLLYRSKHCTIKLFY